MNLKAKLYFVHVIFPILLGGLLYIIFRSNSLRLFQWIEKIGLKKNVDFIRATIFPYRDYFPKWIYFSLPDGLWVYSFVSALLILWENKFEKVKYLILIPIISGILIEIAQLLKLFPGTFDILDLTFTIFALLLSIKIINYKFNQNDKQKKVF